MRRPGGGNRPANQSRNGVSLRGFRDGNRDDQLVSTAAFDNSVRIGYARVSTRAQDHQAQLDALALAHCREVIVETASTRDARPKLASALAMLAGQATRIPAPPHSADSSPPHTGFCPTFRDGLGSWSCQQDSLAEQVESARPYICRLSILIRLTLPSTLPEL